LEAALREKEQRQLSIAPAIGADPPMKRVKILVLGDSGVGKTSIICRLTNNEFNSKLVSTIGIDFKVVKVMVDGNPVQAQIWDTAGSEKFHKITTSYYRGCNGIILVYDISSRKTLENIDYWVSNIKAHATDSVYVAIVGNKMDLRDDPNMADKCVSESEGHAIAEKYHIPYSETSALTSHNLQESFHYIVESVVFADMPPGSHHHSSHSQGGLLGQWRMHTKKSLSTDKKSPSSPQFNTSRALSSSSSGSTTTSNEEGASVHKDKDKCIVS
jgi:small GTP-binding protein